MKISDAAGCLESLGNDTRLAIFRALVRSGPDGLPEIGRASCRERV
jgi:hypothetical protein